MPDTCAMLSVVAAANQREQYTSQTEWTREFPLEWSKGQAGKMDE